MKILSASSIGGMVPLLDSFELPPTIIMKYIEGSSLEDAIRERPNLPWTVKLSIAKKIGEIVLRGHALPQTVLHRDIKPSNIMIQNMEHKGTFDPDVVVLDFDMSWHKGSRERDVVFESRDDFGFLAPEQTDPRNKYTARSTKVDSYGLGMTLFFLFGTEQPRSNEALSDQWLRRALKATERQYEGDWKSAPIRLGRLITRATALDQNSRIDFASIVRELAFIEDALLRRQQLDNPEYWSEEILARMPTNTLYHWDDAIGEGYCSVASGITIKASGNFRKNSALFEIGFQDRGMRERSSLGKYISTAADNSRIILKNGGWTILDHNYSAKDALIRAEIGIPNLVARENESLGATHRVFGEFNFD